MKVGLRFYLTSSVMLLTLASCGRSLLQTGERESWRGEAEAACMKSGAVKIGAAVVQVEPIEGPGICGADFPLNVAALGTGSVVGYVDDPRPPGAIPNDSSAQMPNWPPSDQRYPPLMQSQSTQVQPRRPAQSQPIQSQPIHGGQMRWVPGPPPIEQAETSAPTRYAPTDEPAALVGRPTSTDRPMSIYAPGVAQPDDIPDDAVLPRQPDYREQPLYQRPQQPTYNAPVSQPEPQQQRPLPALGPVRGPQSTIAIMPATLTPTATLACPLVSALDHWVSEGVQPAALRWFGAQVVTIKQISAYSCRSMVGAGSSHISEHAFGNALDVAGFVFADGRTVTVRDGWHGSPEEQGFLHDVQLYACETFTTVLSPGYNAAHYDHIHVDLMRRASGHHPCRPDAIPGEVAAATARSLYASKQHGPAYTGSIASKALSTIAPAAIPGEDGFVEDGDPVTGSTKRRPTYKVAPHGVAFSGADSDDEEPTGSISGWPHLPATSSDVAIRLDQRRSSKPQ